MRNLRVGIGVLVLVACAVGVAGLMAPATSGAGGGGGKFCGGFAGVPCPEGFVCVDDPRDNCDPNQGGADCAGYCKRGH